MSLCFGLSNIISSSANQVSTRLLIGDTTERSSSIRRFYLKNLRRNSFSYNFGPSKDDLRSLFSAAALFNDKLIIFIYKAALSQKDPTNPIRDFPPSSAPPFGHQKRPIDRYGALTHFK